ncbi:hypothetical protein VPH35_020274 [Triticum aestivum]|uniref:Uncharacterized protein n=1 Tax=Triticum turgidum subsp. durum TaxID=4567 RepID=A0A9R1NPK4_TRITD|nr:unnamed protein product [Triticum turgidum subsp. durum]
MCRRGGPPRCSSWRNRRESRVLLPRAPTDRSRQEARGPDGDREAPASPSVIALSVDALFVTDPGRRPARRGRRGGGLLVVWHRRVAPIMPDWPNGSSHTRATAAAVPPPWTAAAPPLRLRRGRG